MHIIFGEERNTLPDNYTILELDRFRLPGHPNPVTAFCVIENIPLGDFPVLDSYIKVHQELMNQYRARNWEYCQGAIKGLLGRWDGELDSFYENLLGRVNNFLNNPPDKDWDGVILKDSAQSN